MDWTDRNFIAKLYLSQRAVIRIDGELSGYCIIGQGVIDKDVLCLHYCLTFISSVINEALEDIQEGANVGSVLIPSIRFADDGITYCKRITSYYGCTAGYIASILSRNSHFGDRRTDEQTNSIDA